MTTENAINRAYMLKAQKAALLECLAEAENDEERQDFQSMLDKFNALHPEID